MLAAGVGDVVGWGVVWVADVRVMAVRAVGSGRVNGIVAGVVADAGEVAGDVAGVDDVTLAAGVDGDTDVDADAVDLWLSRDFVLKDVATEGFSGSFATWLPPCADVPTAVAGGFCDDESDGGELFAPAELSPDFGGWSAHATPPPESTAAPIPNAAANPPIRPMLPAAPMRTFLPPHRGPRKSSQQRTSSIAL